MEPAAKAIASASPSSLILTSGASGRVNALVSLRSLKSFVAYIFALVLLLLGPFRGRNKREEKQQERQSALVKVRPAVEPWKSAAVVALEQEVAARRGLAIRRVVQDDDKDSIREHLLYVTPVSGTLFTQSWTPASLNIRGVVVLMHGLNEHSGRYSDFAKQLNANGFKVYGMDWVGHGGSDGLHAFVPSLDDAVVDMKSYLHMVFAENPDLPCFCFGHSTGGAIILKSVLDPNIESRIAGVAVTSPAVGVQPSHPIFVLLAPVFSFLLPRYQLSVANKKGTAVSRDPEALVAKYSDPLVYTGAIRMRTGYELLRITECLQKNLKSVRVPFLVLHGTSDTVTDPQASKKLYEEASSTDKSIKLYEGLLHDLLFEPERREIVKEIMEWLDRRT